MPCFMFNTVAQLQHTIKLQCPTCITTIHVHHEMRVLFMCVHTSHSKESMSIITQIASKHFSRILYSLDMQSCKTARLPACFGPKYMIVWHLYLAFSFILDVGGNLKWDMCNRELDAGPQMNIFEVGMASWFRWSCQNLTYLPCYLLWPDPVIIIK